MPFHVVQRGETVYSIARQYGVSAERLILQNGLQNVTNALPIGLGLIVAVPEQIYTVSAGDTLAKIADRFDTTLNALWRNNPELGGNDAIFVGQDIVISYRETPLYDFTVGGYAYPFISEQLLNEVLPAMNIAMPFTYGFDASGTVLPLDDENMLARCAIYETVPYMQLSTLGEDGLFDSERADALLSALSLWESFADKLITLMREKGYRGLDIDFEFLSARNRELYPLFIAFMRNKLSPYGYPLIVALPPKTAPDQTGLLYEGADYAQIGNTADRVLLMTYEWGYTYGPPMPVAPLPSVRRVLDYAVSEIPREKIYMGLSNYGYDWTLPYESGVSRARSLSNIEAVELASKNNVPILYSEEYDAPYFFYTDSSGKEHEVWFEDARSIAAKLALIREYGFYGGIYWNLNRPNPQNLTVLAQTIRY